MKLHEVALQKWHWQPPKRLVPIMETDRHGNAYYLVHVTNHPQVDLTVRFDPAISGFTTIYVRPKGSAPVDYKQGSHAVEHMFTQGSKDGTFLESETPADDHSYGLVPTDQSVRAWKKIIRALLPAIQPSNVPHSGTRDENRLDQFIQRLHTLFADENPGEIRARRM